MHHIILLYALIIKLPRNVNSIIIPEPNFDIPHHENPIPFLANPQCQSLSPDFDNREHLPNPSKEMTASIRLQNSDFKAVFGPRFFTPDTIMDEHGNFTERVGIGVMAGSQFCRITSVYNQTSWLNEEFGNELICYHKSYHTSDNPSDNAGQEIPHQEFTPIRRKPHKFSFIAREPYNHLAITFVEDNDLTKPVIERRNRLFLLPINETSPNQQFTVSQCLCNDWQDKYTSIKPAGVTFENDMTVYRKRKISLGDFYKQQDEVDEYCNDKLLFTEENILINKTTAEAADFSKIFKKDLDYNNRHWAYCEEINTTHTNCQCRYPNYHFTPALLFLCRSNFYLEDADCDEYRAVLVKNRVGSSFEPQNRRFRRFLGQKSSW